MKLLLDSHTVLWAMASPDKLGARGRKLLSVTSNDLWVSQVSVIEMTIKINIGKLVYKGGLSELLHDIDFAKFQLLPIERSHLLVYENLPLHHRDPFDRLIIAQAAAEKMPLISKDKPFKQYDIDLIW